MTGLALSLQSFLILPITIIAFIALLTIIVFIHEFGHFSVARMLGVRVDVFSIGFGKTLVNWVDRAGTEWRISMLPLGGYVKFFGDVNAASQAPAEIIEERAHDQAEKQADNQARPMTTQFPRPGHEDEIGAGMTAEERAVCFHFKPVWARAMIVAAGPVYNFILAVAIFAALFMTLGRGYTEPRVAGVVEGSAAAIAGLQAGDEITSINGRATSKFRHLQDAVMVSGGQPLELTVDRGGSTVDLTIIPARVEIEDRYGNPIETWQIGVRGDATAVTFETFGLFEAVQAGVQELWRVLSITVRFIGKIISGQEDASQLGGPIKMAQYAGQSVMSGFDESGYSEPPSFWTMLKLSLIDFISLAAVVSISIGFLNLLPVPVLDGGHLMYYAYEAVAGRPLGAKAQAIGFRLGLVLLASLMIFVTWNDINNLISSIS